MSLNPGVRSAPEGLGKKSVHSALVSVGAKVVIAAVQLGTTVILARLLTPDDFGLVAMVAALIGFAPVLIDFGTSDATTQRAELSEKDVSTLFWFNMGVGLGLALLLIVCSPLISRLYGEARLEMVAIVLSLQMVFLAVACQYSALLRRAMRFRHIALVEVVGNILSAAIAVAMALNGFAYWALVARPVFTALFTALGLVLACRWMPGRPGLTGDVKALLAFGANITGFTILDYVGRTADRVALGIAESPKEVGFYQQALGLYENALYLITLPLHGVAVSSLSKLQGNAAQLRLAWHKAISTLAFFGMPLFGILAVTSQDLVKVVLGAKWEEAGLLLAVFAVRGVAHLAERTLGWLHVATGRADRWRTWGLISTVVQLAAVIIGLPFGALGVAVALTVSTFALVIPTLAYAGSPAGISYRLVIDAIGRQLIGSLGAVAVGFLTKYWLLASAGWASRVLIVTLVYIAVYWLVVVVILRVREPVTFATNAIGTIRRR